MVLQEQAEGPAMERRHQCGRVVEKRKVSECFLSKFRFRPLNPDIASTS